jgi:hypothetical protein
MPARPPAPRARARGTLVVASLALATLAAVPSVAAAADEPPAVRTLHLAFELEGDPGDQRVQRVGADGSLQYGVGRLTGSAELDGRPVEVESMFSLRYADGSGPFSGWLTLASADGDVLGLGYEGLAVRRGTTTRITGVVEVVGGSGAFEGVAGVGRMSATRDGQVGSGVRYELVLDLEGLPARAAEDPFVDPDAAGVDLFRAYSERLVERDVEALRAIIDPAFLIVRGDGSFAGRDDYLANLPDLRSFSFRDVHEVRSDGGVALRMTTTADLTVDGAPFRTEPAPMLAAFRWQDGRWLLVAQGNFNRPR